MILTTHAAANPPWWLVTAIGVIAGALLTRFGSVLLYPVRFLRKDKFHGIWYEYHWTWAAHRQELWHARVTIERGVFSKYRIRLIHTHDGQTTGLKNQYKGELREENGQVVITYFGIGFHETAMFRYPGWLPDKEVVAGLWLSYDHTNTPASGGSILSRREFPDDQVRTLLSKAIGSYTGLLRLKAPHPSVPTPSRSERLPAN